MGPEEAGCSRNDREEVREGDSREFKDPQVNRIETPTLDTQVCLHWFAMALLVRATLMAHSITQGLLKYSVPETTLWKMIPKISTRLEKNVHVTSVKANQLPNRQNEEHEVRGVQEGPKHAPVLRFETSQALLGAVPEAPKHHQVWL